MAHDQRSRRRPSHCTQSQARAARRRSVRCGYRDAAYYTHTHVHTPPTSVSVGAYESDNESDDAVDDQKGRRRQPEKSDEARAVHTLRCLYRGSEGAPPSRAQVQRPKKKDLSYFRLTSGEGRRHAVPAPPGGAACLRDGGRGPASGRCQQLFYCPSLTSLLVLMRPVNKPHSNILDPQGHVPRKS